MTKPFSSILCPKCLKKNVYPAAAKHGDTKFSWGRCSSCGWYGKLKSCPRV